MTYQPMPQIRPRAVGRDTRARFNGMRGRLALVLMLAGLFAATIAIVGLMGRSLGYLIVDSVTGNTAGTILVALTLLLAGVLIAPLDTWHPVRLLGSIFLTVAWCGMAFLLALSSGFGQTSYVSPDGRSRLVVQEGAAMIDPTWELTVRQNSPWVARYWYVACFNGDDPDNSLDSVQWLSSTTIATVDGAGGKREINLEPATLRPDEVLSIGCY